MADMERLIADLSRMQIADFFHENAGVTQLQCDQRAAELVGGPVRASTVQGSTSYTVVPVEGSGNDADGTTGLVVQYRAAAYALDLDMLHHIRLAYGPRFVPGIRSPGTVGKLSVYAMDDVGGVAAYLARDQLRAHGGRLLRTTLADFAEFFAAPWHSTPPAMPSPDRYALCARYAADLELLCVGLPARFRTTLRRLVDDLPTLFADDWSLVPSHTDLLENNIHVDPATGCIAGVCDWADAAVAPFGASLEGADCLLGERTTAGWRWVDGAAELRRGFYGALEAAIRPDAEADGFRERIATARLVGVFRQHGLVWVDTETRAAVAEGSSEMAYLEAVTLDLEDDGFT